MYTENEKFKNNSQLIAIGVNCTAPELITDLLKSVDKLSKPFIVYPNDGSDWDAVNRMLKYFLFSNFKITY